MSRSILRVEHLSRVYGGVHALRDVSFSIEPGAMVGIIGPNGAGKTTLFNILSGIDRPTAGRTWLFEKESTHLPPHQVRRMGVARTFQAGRPFEGMTVRENLLVAATFGGTNHGGRRLEHQVDEVLGLIGMQAVGDRLARSLTVTERKILEIGRSVVSNPRLLLLDEVLAGLSPEDLDKGVEIIRRIWKQLGVTVLWIEHLLDVLFDACEHVIVLNHGQKLTEGQPEQIIRDPRVIESYLGSSMEVER